MRCEQLRHLADRVDAVVHEEYLPAAAHLAQDCLAHHRLREARHLGADREAVGRRRVDRRHVAQPGERHLQRARDRRGGERQHVHRLLELLDALLVGDAEALLLVHHEQAEVAEFDVLLQQPVRADDDVQRAVRQALHHLLLLLRGTESRQRLDADRVAVEAFAEGRLVLRTQNRGGHQHGHLFAVRHGLEGGTHGHLGLAEADVAAHQAVHRLAVLHVGEHVLDRGLLVGCLLVLEGALELLERAVARREREALRQFARGVDAEQLARHVAQRLLDVALGLLPGDAAQLVDPRRHALGADVALHQRQAVHRHEESIAAVVLDAQELVAGRFARAPGRRRAARARGRCRCRARRARGRSPVFSCARDSSAAASRIDTLVRRRSRGPKISSSVTIDGARERQREALGDRRDAHFQLARPAPVRDLACVAREARVVTVFEQQLAQALGARERRRREHHAPALATPALDRLDQRQQRCVAGSRAREFAAQLLVVGRAQRDAFSRVVGLDVEPFEPDRCATRERLLHRFRRE